MTERLKKAPSPRQQRDKVVRMASLRDAAEAVCVPCRLETQTNFFANDEAYHPWDGYGMPCAASKIWVLYAETSRR